MQKSRLKKAGKRVLQIGLPVVILVLFFREVQQNWNSLTAHSFSWNPWLLVAAFLGFICQELSFGLIWQSVLARLGQRIPFRVSLRIYLASEFVRYIPGNVWHVLTRILWVSRYGVSRPVAFASMTIELITKLAAGALVFAVSLLFWRDFGALGSLLAGSIVPILGGVLIVALLVVLHPRVLSGLLNTALKLLKRKPVELALRYRDILLVTAMWSISWFVAGCAFYVLLLSIAPQTPLTALPVCIGIYAIAWDIGFVSFITPSGLGFREGAIAALFALAVPLPLSVGPIIALLSRLVSTMAELLCVGLAYISGGQQMREVRLEQGSRHSLNEEQGVETEAVSADHVTSYVGMERGGGSE